MPPKRAASKETQAETQACQRYRQAIDVVAEEYVCPITAELPIDPVTAEVRRTAGAMRGAPSRNGSCGSRSRKSSRP